MKNKLIKRQKGITLVALVVTIVVLLILAGITIMYTMGENSIFKKAQDAKDKTADAVKNEQEYMNEVDNMVDKYINGTGNGGGTDTPTEEPIENIKSDWEMIEKIAGEIAKEDSITSDTEKVTVIVDNKKYTISAGDLFEVEYKGEVRIVRALGFKHDDLVNTAAYGGNHNKASISFEFLDFMTGENYMPVNSTNTNENGWANTQMRKDLNGYTTNAAVQGGEIGGLGANLNNKAYIKQVKKKYIGTYDDASSIATSNDYLWLLAASEIVNNGYNGSGTYGYAITSEGSQYKYYQGVTDAWNVNSIKRTKKTSSSGNAYGWWLRSPGYGYSYSFCNIDGNGNNYNSHASYSSGVAPGFCI
ncbi:MAG: prepilin-type N-terminal cleavage/methylation domain-containing protein [Clostridia bacterium]|nr:prepilin-type N-terminal cleavage/methylation domain-containing protein [Clostridia bacterium]